MPFNSNAVGGGCASDLITKRKLEQMVKEGAFNLPGRIASNKILKSQINAIRCTNQTDAFGNAVAKTWFGVIVTDEEAASCFPIKNDRDVRDVKIVTEGQKVPPIMYSTPSSRITEKTYLTPLTKMTR